MHAVILLLVFFFYNGGVKTISAVAPSADACLATGPEVVQKAEADEAVRDATWACYDVTGGDKS